jgi:hypothetical protein
MNREGRKGTKPKNAVFAVKTPLFATENTMKNAKSAKTPEKQRFLIGGGVGSFEKTPLKGKPRAPSARVSVNF